MNALNRTLVILLTLAAFFIVTVAFVVPAESLTVVKGLVDSTLRTLGRIRPEFVIPFRALLVLCALFVDALLVGLLVLEIRGPAKRTIRIRRVGGGEVIVTIESIAERVQYHVDQLADVVGVKAQVKPRGGGVELDVHVQTGAEINVPEKGEQILQIAKQVVEEKMGLMLAGKPRVHLHALPVPPMGARPPARAVEPARPSADKS